MRADTRRLTALLRLLRQNGVAEYSDGPLTVKFAPPKAEAPVAAREATKATEAPTSPDDMHSARLRALVGGLFNADGEVG